MNGTPHKHHDAIIAFANDQDVEYCRSDRPNVWKSWRENYGEDSTPPFHVSGVLWRPKRKIVKRKGWVNIYKTDIEGFDRKADLIHHTKESANELGAGREACIRIEWEEESHD